MGTTTLAQTSLLNYPGKSGNSEEQDEPPNNRGQKQKPGQPSLSLMTRPARWVDQGSGPVDREESGSVGAAREAVCTTPGVAAWRELDSFTSSIEGQARQVLLSLSYYLKPGI